MVELQHKKRRRIRVVGFRIEAFLRPAAALLPVPSGALYILY